MPKRRIAVLFCAIMFCAFASPSGAEMNDRLSQEHFGSIQPGAYQAGDTLKFTLDHYQSDRYQNEYLMRFSGQPEVYVLYADYGSLGGRVLKYDSGSIVIQVAGWGGMTLYTDDSPGGLPAVRMGDSTVPSLGNVSSAQLQSAADDEAAHLAYARGIHLTITADWNTGDGGLRALTFDAMENAARGIDRFAANPAAHNIFSQRVTAVAMQTSDKPIIKMQGKTLIVTFNPHRGYEGRASSRAISYALGKLFAVPTPN